MFKLLSIIFFAFCIHEAFSQRKAGQCPEVKPFETFDVNKFTGIWYDYARSPEDAPVLENGRCLIGNYILQNNILSYFGSAIDVNTGKEITTFYDGEYLGQGAFNVRDQPYDKTNLYVLATDYNNYAALKTCVNINQSTYTELFWVFSRKRTLEDNYYTLAKNGFTGLNVELSSFVKYNQNNCTASQ